MTNNVERRFRQHNGELVGGEFVIDMNSLLCTDIENQKYKKKLEDHLKDKDFFDVSNFPNSGIKITDVDKVEAESYRITADLSRVTESRSTLKEGELAVVESSDILTLLESTRTSNTPSTELTETRMLFDLEASSDRYLVPVIIKLSPSISALVRGFSGS